MYVLHTDNARNPWTLDCKSGSQAETGLHLSPPKEKGPLTQDILVHKDPVILQKSKIFRFNL